MNRSRRPPRKPSKLSESLHKRLNAYAWAAGAAGVGALALSQSAEAKIVYTPVHKSITPNHTIPLDLNHDGTIDFRFKDTHLTTASYGFSHIGILSILPAHHANKIEGYSTRTRHYASALPAGAAIGTKGRFAPGPKLMATVYYDSGLRELKSTCDGPWSNAKDRYLGLEFFIEGKVHFGWARLNVSCPGTDVIATLTGYAYETIPNKPIIAGKTHGEDDVDPGSGAALTNPIPDIPQPTSLGALALGAPGLSIWRRKESVGAGR